MTAPVDLQMRSYPSSPRSARAARDFVVAELRRATATERAVADFELIVSELVANSVQYGNGTEIVVGVDAVTEDWYTVSISSGVDGALPPLDPEKWTVADPEQRSGRGLGIVRSLADDLSVAVNDGRLVIVCRRHR